MKDKICWVRQEDVPKVWVHKGKEYSHRLINKKDQNCGFSFHITTYEPHFDTIVEGDGIHEVVLYCLHGSSKQIDLSDNREHNFSIGDAIYLPLHYRYRHIVGDCGLVVAVCCNPSRKEGEI